MTPAFIGLFFVGLGLLQLKYQRVPAGGMRITGTVIEEVSVTSSQTGRNTKMYAPKVRFLEPHTGNERVYEPKRHTNDRFSVGESVDLIYDQRKNAVHHPDRQPYRTTIITVGFGLLIMTFPFWGGAIPW